MEAPLNNERLKECFCCKGNGSLIGYKVKHIPGRPRGVVECKACKGTGRVTEAKYWEDRNWFESLPQLPPPGEIADDEKGEEWKRQ